MSDRAPTAPADAAAFAGTLRRLRAARRLSQLDLALDCDVSARHLSFLESGRARPSREMVLTLADGLLLHPGARNALLQAAGFAPLYPASALGSEALAPLAAALGDMMAKHAPNPAILCDRHWVVRDANPTARALLAALAPEAAEINVVRLLSEGPAAEAAILNLAEVVHEMRERIALETLESPGDPVLAELLAGLDAAAARHPLSRSATQRRALVPVVVASPQGPLSFLSAVAQFGTSEDATVRDLRLELLFPADAATAEAMVALAAALCEEPAL